MVSDGTALQLIRRPAPIWAVASLLVVACQSASAPTAPSAAAIEPTPVRRVVVLGDSLAVSPSMRESFPSHLDERVTREGRRYAVTNAGVRGDTTAGGVRRVEALLAGDVAVLVIALGSNDGLRGIDLSIVEKNLATMIELARQRDIRVLVCGMEVPPIHGWDYTVGFHFLFPRLAQQYAVPLVPFLLADVALTPDMNGPDGIHPNAAGAQRIAETIWPHLEPLLRQ
jgi:acyl-CoA thioesterase-1